MDWMKVALRTKEGGVDDGKEREPLRREDLIFIYPGQDRRRKAEETLPLQHSEPLSSSVVARRAYVSDLSMTR